MKKFFLSLFIAAAGLSFAQTNMLINGIGQLSLLGCTSDGSSIRITGTGNVQANKAYFNSETTLEDLDMNLSLRVDSLSSGHCIFGIGKYSAIAGTMVKFNTTDTSCQVLVYVLNGTAPTLAAQFPLSFPLTADSSYAIRIGKRERFLQIEVTSHDLSHHFLSDTLSYPTPFFGCLWGTPFVGSETSTIYLDDFTMTTPLSLSPRLAVWGDSFIEGNSLDHIEDRYVSLIRDSIGGQNISILGRGGESSTSLVSRFSQESRWFRHSKYALVAIGVNDHSFSTWQVDMLHYLDSLRQHNIVPIIATLTPRSDRLSFIASANNWIRNVYDGAYVDLTKAISTSSETHILPGMGLSDSIHPSPAGHLAMLQRIRVEAPYIFRDYDAFTINYFDETTNENVSSGLKYATASGFASFSFGSNLPAPLTPGQNVYFKDTAVGPGVNIVYDILAVPLRPARPSNPVMNVSAGTFDWTNNPYFTAVTDYEFSLDSGLTWTTCFEKPIVSAGTETLQLRVKATSTNFKGEVLYFDTLETGILAQKTNNIRIFPNPAVSTVYIENTAPGTTLMIYNENGRLVRNVLMKGSRHSLDISDLGNGLYLLKLVCGASVTTYKILKE